LSHKHFCEVTGHEWVCEGTAMRPLAGDIQPSICICGTCHVPMEEGDHSECMIELLACPEHMDEQLAQVLVCPEDNICLGCGLPMNTHDYEQCRTRPRMKAPAIIQYEPPSPVPHCACGCADAAPDNAVAWCMWCDHVYVDYTRKTEDQHFAHHCPEPPAELRESARKRLAEGKA
jgi:hypothetical protein